jgi:hypothetical protein
MDAAKDKSRDSGFPNPCLPGGTGVLMDEVLLDRLRNLGAGRKWMFESRAGTPVNPNNIRRRFLKPAAEELGIPLCGGHDFRHSLTPEDEAKWHTSESDLRSAGPQKSEPRDRCLRPFELERF